MDMLLERGRMNGVKLESISANEARRIEQKAKTFERAIFSPATSSANPTTVGYSAELLPCLDVICCPAEHFSLFLLLTITSFSFSCLLPDYFLIDFFFEHTIGN